MRLSVICLPIACAWMWAGCAATSSVKTTKDENPWPYGKAEIEASRINDVLILLRRAEQYRSDCVELAAAGGSFVETERLGREAKNWYRAVLDSEPSNAYASLCIGYVDLMLGRACAVKKDQLDYLSAAMSRFREALEKRSGYADAYLYIAQVHALRDEYDEAEKNLRPILDSGIEDSQVQAWMAYVLFQKGVKDEAAKCMARAIELDDPSPSARWSRENQGIVRGGR